MPIDDRKQRILLAIVSLYSTNAEPIGSNLLSQYFDMAVSSATLRNEMAALTRLGLLEQPHTSAGRVPTSKGYRYYVDHLLRLPTRLQEEDRLALSRIFQTLDHDPEKLAQGAAAVFAELLKYAVVTTTPRAEDMRIAHFEVLQVGRFTAAVLAVTNAGGVRTRVARVDFELDEEGVSHVAKMLNRSLRFVAEMDVTPRDISSLVDSLGEGGSRYWPILSASLTLLSEVGTPSVYVEGHKNLLLWPELEPALHTVMELFTSPKELEEILRPTSAGTSVLFGDELKKPVPELCIITCPYLAGGGRTGIIAVGGPSRMEMWDVIPKLEYFSELLGKAMSDPAA